MFQNRMSDFGSEDIERNDFKAERGQMAREVESEVTLDQKKILDKLRSAKNAAERVEFFGKIVDDLGIDAVVSAVIPEMGDAGVSMVAGLYMLCEAKNQDMGMLSYLKIVSLQAADFAIGAIPIVGDIADYFFKANKWTAQDFKKLRAKLEVEARAAGVPEVEIAKINQAGNMSLQIVKRAVQLAGSKGLLN